MKISTITWYIVIAAILYFIIYKAYTNYKISGNIFKSSTIIGLANTPAVNSNNGIWFDPNAPQYGPNGEILIY